MSEREREKGGGKMNLLGGFEGDKSKRKSIETCTTKVVFVGDTKPGGLIFLLSSLFVAA